MIICNTYESMLRHTYFLLELITGKHLCWIAAKRHKDEFEAISQYGLKVAEITFD